MSKSHASVAGKQNSGRQPARPGTVIAHHGAQLIVEDEAGWQFPCMARKQLGALVSGDRVLWQEQDQHAGVIVEGLPRHSQLIRPDARGKPRVIAANIDQILIINASRPELKSGLIDRYLVAAELSGIQPIIILNKADLLGTEQHAEYQQRMDIYRRIGYTVLFTSTVAAHGLDGLLEVLRGHVSILAGQSGVGKSSLLNHILPEAGARVGEVSDASNKGRHTTTTAWLYHLPDGQGDIIDSPGIREFGLWQVEPGQLAQGFREFAPAAENCRFRNCLHHQEPGCAVQAAVDTGDISRERHTSYLRLLAEAQGVVA